MTALPSIDQMNDWNTANNGLGVTEAQWRALFAQFYAFVQENQGGGGAVDTIYNADGTIADNRLVNLNGKSLQFREYTPSFFDGVVDLRGGGLVVRGGNLYDAPYNTVYSFDIGFGFHVSGQVYDQQTFTVPFYRTHNTIVSQDLYGNFTGTNIIVQSLDGNRDITPYDVAAGIQVGKEGELISYANSNQNGGIYTQIQQTATETVVESNFDGYEGIKYANDHSANFTDRSLVDKKFTDTTYLKIADAAPLGYPVPVGTVAEFSSTTAPELWLKLDGSELDRANCPHLFEVIGETFGAGDGSTTFLIDNRPHPDARMIYMIKFYPA